jgi:dienelactone hydrolase
MITFSTNLVRIVQGVRMRISLFLSVLIGMFFVSSLACAEVVGTEVKYKAGETSLQGYLAYESDIQGKRPAVIVVHEWWGHNDYARTRARELAKLGYTAFALDMYGDGKTASHPKDAKAFSSSVGSDLALERFSAALAELKKHETVDPSKIAAIGYCFGGKIVLNMARLGTDLKGVVSFHGALATETPAEKGKVKARVLVFHGAEDTFVPTEASEQFKNEMTEAGVDYTFVILPGAKHSFSNPGATEVGKKFNLPLEYSKTADEASWAGMKKFFGEIF